MSINTIIEEQKKEFEDGSYVPFADSNWNEDNIKGYNAHKEDFYNWHIQSIKQILDSEIERLKGMKEKYIPNEQTTGFTVDEVNCYRDGYKDSIADQITHLTNIIKEIK